MVRSNAHVPPFTYIFRMDRQDRQTFSSVLFSAFRQPVTYFLTSGEGIPTVNTDSYLQWRNWSRLPGGGGVEDRLLTKLNVVRSQGNGTTFLSHLSRTLIREHRRRSLGEPWAIPNVDLELDPVRCGHGCSWILCTIEKIGWISLLVVPRYICFVEVQPLPTWFPTLGIIVRLQRPGTRLSSLQNNGGGGQRKLPRPSQSGFRGSVREACLNS